jgi:hypothetical protein
MVSPSMTLTEMEVETDTASATPVDSFGQARTAKKPITTQSTTKPAKYRELRGLGPARLVWRKS